MAGIFVMKAAVTLVEERDWNWLDAGRWWISAGLCQELAPQKKFDAYQVVQAEVSAPHASKDLHHTPEISLDGTLADGSAARCQDAYIYLIHAYLEVGNWLCNAGLIRGDQNPST